VRERPHTQYTKHTVGDPSGADSVSSTLKIEISRHSVIDEDKLYAIRLGAVLLANWSADASVLNKKQGMLSQQTRHTVAVFNNRSSQMDIWIYY
jgi:hypothetical protein